MKTAILRAVLAVLALLLATSSIIGRASAAPQILWKKQLGTPAGDQVRYLRTDADGNVVIAYQYSVGTPGSEYIAYSLIKYGSSGNQIWRTELSGGDIFGIAIDPAGNVYAAIQSLISGIDLVKYSSEGILIWQRPSNVGNYVPGLGPGSFVSGLAVDGSGRPAMAVTASYYGADAKIGIVAYTTAGAFWWKKTLLGNALCPYGSGLAADADGNFVIVGRKSDSPYYCDSQVWIAKYANNGTLAWIKTYNTSTATFIGLGMAIVNDVTTDTTRNIVVAGWAGGDLGSSPPRCGSSGCAWIAKFNSNGGLIWTRVKQYRLTNANYTDSMASSVSVSESGMIVLAGRRTIWSTDTGYLRPWLAAFDPNGNSSWEWYWPLTSGKTNADATAGVSLDPLGNIVFGGETRGPLAGPYKGIPGDSYTDGFVAKLKP